MNLFELHIVKFQKNLKNILKYVIKNNWQLS